MPWVNPQHPTHTKMAAAHAQCLTRQDLVVVVVHHLTHVLHKNQICLLTRELPPPVPAEPKHRLSDWVTLP